MALYMVVERFRNGDAAPVYRRFREEGRLAPEGLAAMQEYRANFDASVANMKRLREQRLARNASVQPMADKPQVRETAVAVKKMQRRGSDALCFSRGCVSGPWRGEHKF